MLNGRYGPYITNKLKNAKIPKDKTPTELTLEECQALLAAAPERRGRGMKRKPMQAAAEAPAEPTVNAAKKAAAAPKKKKKKKRKKAATRKRAAETAAEEAGEPPAE